MLPVGLSPIRLEVCAASIETLRAQRVLLQVLGSVLYMSICIWASFSEAVARIWQGHLVQQFLPCLLWSCVQMGLQLAFLCLLCVQGASGRGPRPVFLICHTAVIMECLQKMYRLGSMGGVGNVAWNRESAGASVGSVKETSKAETVICETLKQSCCACQVCDPLFSPLPF